MVTTPPFDEAPFDEAQGRPMDGPAIDRAVKRMAQEIVERWNKDGDIAVIGVRRGGVHLAKRLQSEIAALANKPPIGTLDIALYRDDVSERAAPVVGPTEIDFPIDGKTIVLVDDVLYTGRTIRAALSEINDFGRPRRVWLAVLIDRGGRELPIQPDFVGVILDERGVQKSEERHASEIIDVEVRLREGGAPEDGVVIRRRGRTA